MTKVDSVKDLILKIKIVVGPNSQELLMDFFRFTQKIDFGF